MTKGARRAHSGSRREDERWRVSAALGAVLRRPPQYRRGPPARCRRRARRGPRDTAAEAPDRPRRPGRSGRRACRRTPARRRGRRPCAVWAGHRSCRRSHGKGTVIPWPRHLHRRHRPSRAGDRRRRARQRATRLVAGPRALTCLHNGAPRVLHTDDGDFWSFEEGKRSRAVGLAAHRPRPLEFNQFRPEGLRYSDIRPGLVRFRRPGLHDLDIDGISRAGALPIGHALGRAALCGRIASSRLACVQAYNDWLAEFCEGGAAAG